MKILILKPSSLGDVVQALPVLRLIRRHRPEARVCWWIDSSLAPLLAGDPDLAGVVPFERRGWTRGANWIALCRSIAWMRAQRFDWVIDLQSLARSGAVAWLANGKRTIGMDTPREGARGFYDIIVRRPSFHTHAVDWYLRVLPVLGVPVHNGFQWLPERPAISAALRRSYPLHERPWIVLQPGARWQNKRWPVEHFVELARQVAATRPALGFAVLGSAEDAPLGQAICGAAPGRCLDLTGRLSLLEMVECIRLAKVMVTNDTGPMHVAAALGIPVVALFGPTEPARTGPYGQVGNAIRLDLPCVPCMRPRCSFERPIECLRAITPASVARAVEARLPVNLKSETDPGK